MYNDIRRLREHYAALRDLISRNAGGLDHHTARADVALLCGAAIVELDDSECQQCLRTVARHAAELYSADGHRKWDREHMSGAQYLRRQILIALESVNTRLFLIETLRNRLSPAPGELASRSSI